MAAQQEAIEDQAIAKAESPPPEKPKETKEDFGYSNSEFRIVDGVYTMRQLLDSRKPGLRSRRCVVNVVPKGDGAFLSDKGKYTFLESARLWTVAEVIESRSKFGSESHFLTLDEEQLAKEPPVRKMDIEMELDQLLVHLLKVAPQNGAARAALMSVFGTMPPPELVTYEQVRDWVEFSFSPPQWRTDQTRLLYGYKDKSLVYGGSPASSDPGETDQPRRRGASDAPEIRCGFTIKESGLCQYSRVATVLNTVKINPDSWTRIARQALSRGDGFKSLVNQARNAMWNYAAETIQDQPINFTETVTQDHESVSLDVVFDEAFDQELAKQVKQYIQYHYGKEAQEGL